MALLPKRLAKKATTRASTAIDHERLRDAFDDLEVGDHPFLNQRTVDYYGKKIAASGVRSYEELLAPDGMFDGDPETLGNALIVALAAARALPKSACVERSAKRSVDLATHDAKLFPGHFRVDGNLLFAGRLFVLGDLVVSGVIESHEEFATLFATGSVRAKGLNLSRWCNSIYAGGRIEVADVIAAAQNVAAGRGTKTHLLLECDGFWRAWGKLVAKVRLDVDELPDAIESRAAVLAGLLVPGAFAARPDLAPVHALVANLFDRLRRGKRVFVSS